MRNVPAGGTVTMLRDLKLGKAVNLNTNKTYTIDLGGYKLTNDAQFHNMFIVENGTVTIKNGEIHNDYWNGIHVIGGSVTLDDLNLKADGSDETQTIQAVFVSGGTVEILSGSYYGSSHAINSSAGTVTITSGEFESSGTGYNGATNAVLATITDSSFNNPQGVAVNERTNLVYITNRAGDTVTVIRAADNSVIAEIPVGDNPYGVAVDEAANRIYVANLQDDTISVIDGETNTVLDTIAVGDGPRNLVIVRKRVPVESALDLW